MANFAMLPVASLAAVLLRPAIAIVTASIYQQVGWGSWVVGGA